jgi:hypothetical protein
MPYIYFPELHEVRGAEIGALLTMDGRPEVPFAKDPQGNWYFDTSRRDEDGCFDLSWSTRVINSLLKKGWVVEEGTYDDHGRPLKVLRSAKPGYPADE